MWSENCFSKNSFSGKSFFTHLPFEKRFWFPNRFLKNSFNPWLHPLLLPVWCPHPCAAPSWARLGPVPSCRPTARHRAPFLHPAQNMATLAPPAWEASHPYRPPKLPARRDAVGRSDSVAGNHSSAHDPHFHPSAELWCAGPPPSTARNHIPTLGGHEHALCTASMQLLAGRRQPDRKLHIA